jgi:hypothetical protein
MSTTKTNADGQQRKTLASQLDRLDAILDTLGEGLDEAVAQAVQQAVELAVREGVHRGVRGALAEVLTNPEVLAVLRAAAAPAADARPAPAGPPRSGGRWGWLKAWLQKARSALGAGLRRARQVASAAWNGLSLLRPVRGRLPVALGVGAAGVGAYFAGPYVAAAAGALAGVLSTLAARAGIAFRRLTAHAARAG